MSEGKIHVSSEERIQLLSGLVEALKSMYDWVMHDINQLYVELGTRGFHMDDWFIENGYEVDMDNNIVKRHY
jgi:hypothetical protein